jgi:hypothetical protein
MRQTEGWNGRLVVDFPSASLFDLPPLLAFFVVHDLFFVLLPSVRIFCLAAGKDGNPMGVVWRGGVHIVCSTEAQENEMAYYPSP